MRFSLYSELQLHPGKTAEQLYGEVLEQIVNADRLGYDVYAVIEHFFFPKFSVSTNPTALFAAAAQKTARIRFRTMLHALPHHNPVGNASPLTEWPTLPADALNAAGYGFDAAGIMEGLTEIPYEKLIEDDYVWVGTPHDIIERIEATQVVCAGVEEIGSTVNAGGAPHSIAIKNQELFASAVIPHFQRAGELAGVTP